MTFLQLGRSLEFADNNDDDNVHDHDQGDEDFDDRDDGKT